jgi:hypothetical protein
MRSFQYFIVLIALVCISVYAQNESTAKAKYDVFSFDKRVTLPGNPEIIFDAVTGDISRWWDHSFTDNPKKFFIEPVPGGGFWEIFDDEGNGVLHARVIYADRGKMLRYDGPLGLSGKAIQIVTTYQFEPVGTDSTLFKVSVHAAGEVEEGIPAIVARVWEHFVFEQLEPYIKAGKHLEEK